MKEVQKSEDKLKPTQKTKEKKKRRNSHDLEKQIELSTALKVLGLGWVFFPPKKKHVLRIRFSPPSGRASRKRRRGIKSHSFPLALPLTAPSVGLSLTCVSAAIPPAPCPRGGGGRAASGAALSLGTKPPRLCAAIR